MRLMNYVAVLFVCFFFFFFFLLLLVVIVVVVVVVFGGSYRCCLEFFVALVDIIQHNYVYLTVYLTVSSYTAMDGYNFKIICTITHYVSNNLNIALCAKD